MEGMSARAYARHRGVHHSTVQEALTRGRIHATPEGLINAPAADRAWPARTGAERRATRAAGPRGPRTAPANGAEARAREQRRIGRLLGGFGDSRADDEAWLSVVDARELAITQAAEDAVAELAPVLVGMDEDEMRDAMTEALDRALLAAEKVWRNRYR